jgi:hypothetical protein
MRTAGSTKGRSGLIEQEPTQTAQNNKLQHQQQQHAMTTSMEDYDPTFVRGLLFGPSGSYSEGDSNKDDNEAEPDVGISIILFIFGIFIISL